MFTAQTTYDQVMRYLLQKTEEGLLFWLTRLSARRLRFDGWLPTQLTMPGQKERICDAIADLADLRRHELPVAALVEVSTFPDPLMFARLQIAGGLCWATRKPTDLPGDRYHLLAVVVNLTGTGNCVQDMRCSGGRWLCRPIERNLCSYSAEQTLREIDTGKAPLETLALISLMQGGDDPAIIREWLRIADREPDLSRRGDLSLVTVLADAAGRGQLWRDALGSWNMLESQIVSEWKSLARAEGKAEGKSEGLREGERKAKTEWLLQVVGRWGQVPEELATKIRSLQEQSQLDQLLQVALSVKTLAQFRKKAGL